MACAPPKINRMTHLRVCFFLFFFRFFLNCIPTMAEALTTTDLQGALPLVARGKVRDLYEIDDKTLLFVATDRISAYDVIMENVYSILSLHYGLFQSIHGYDEKLIMVSSRVFPTREFFSPSALAHGSTL